MTQSFRAIFRVTDQTAQALAQHWAELLVEPCDDVDTFWLGGPPLGLAQFGSDYRAGLAKFVGRANCLIALIDADLSAIASLGSLEVIEGGVRHRICLVETARLEFNGMPIILSARGTTKPIRPLAERSADLFEHDARFAHATSIFASCGEDLRDLFKVVELIERAHGGMPKKRNDTERRDFFARIEVTEEDWVALHRSFRPERHAEPHDMDGRIISPRLARILVQHALKLWLTREIPA